MRFFGPLIWASILLEIKSEEIECTTCPDTCTECSCLLSTDGTELTICEVARKNAQFNVADHDSHGDDCDHDEDCLDVTHIGIVKWVNQWPKTEGLANGYNRELLWTYDENTIMDNSFVKNVHIAMDELQKDLQCIKLTYKEFEKLTPEDEHGILFQEGDSCMSYVGYAPGSFLGDGESFADAAGLWTGGENWQNILMSYEACLMSIDSFQHEVLHALGMVHEFARPDRLDFIDITPKGSYTIDNFPETEEIETWVTKDKACFQMLHFVVLFFMT